MAGAIAGVKIRGAAELERALLQLRRDVLVGLKPAIIAAAGPVADAATANAESSIANIGTRWDRFRLGATVKGVYVAPKYRRRGGSPRKNLGPLLLAAMEKAVDQKQDEVVGAVDLLIETSRLKAGL